MKIAEAESQAERAKENLKALQNARHQKDEDDGELAKYESSPENIEADASPNARVAIYDDHS